MPLPYQLHSGRSDAAFQWSISFRPIPSVNAGSSCPATIGDDSAIVRTFDADKVHHETDYLEVFGRVSERMILLPELTDLNRAPSVRPSVKIAGHIVGNRKEGVVIHCRQTTLHLVGRRPVVHRHESGGSAVAELQQGQSTRPFIFANRYDGIDLPGSSCRLLIMSGLPRGVGDYELYRANTFLGGSELDSTLAQRLEQGMGRGARGAGDYCVVLLLGKDLIAWLRSLKNQNLLTSSTRAQFEIGRTVSKNVSDESDLSKTVGRCLKRSNT